MNNCAVFFLFIFLFFSSAGLAQEKKYNGTIKVQKKGHLVKTQFDNVNYRLIGIDQYGNIIDSAVIEFQISVTIKGIFYSEKITGPVLSNNMQQVLDKCDRTSKIFFDKIKAKDRDGTIMDMPKFQYTFGYIDEDY